MEENWIKVFSTSEEYQAEIAKEILENEGIQTVVLNKRDSSYVTVGDIDVFVHKDNEKQALELLKELIN